MAAKTIKVHASPSSQQNKTVVLFERHPDHPNGEVFISGNDTIHTVAQTTAVRQKLHDGLLVEVTAPAKAGVAKAPKGDDGKGDDGKENAA